MTAILIAWHIAGLINYAACVAEHNAFDEEPMPANKWIYIALICQFTGLALIPFAYWRMNK